MKDLTEDLVVEAFLAYADLHPESVEEYKTAFLKTLNKVRSLEDGEMLCRIYELNRGHQGWWIEADGVDGFITDVQMPKEDERTFYGNERVVVIDGLIHNIPRRQLVVINRIKKEQS